MAGQAVEGTQAGAKPRLIPGSLALSPGFLRSRIASELLGGTQSWTQVPHGCSSEPSFLVALETTWTWRVPSPCLTHYRNVCQECFTVPKTVGTYLTNPTPKCSSMPETLKAGSGVQRGERGEGRHLPGSSLEALGLCGPRRVAGTGTGRDEGLVQGAGTRNWKKKKVGTQLGGPSGHLRNLNI